MLNKNTVDFKPLTNEYFKTVESWLKKAWGSLAVAEVDSIDYRLKHHQNCFHLAFYKKELIGMFALLPFESQQLRGNRKQRVLNKELDYVYVREDYRGRGLCALLIQKAQEIEKKRGANALFLETYEPKLTQMYRLKYGAKLLVHGFFCKSAFQDFLYMELEPNEDQEKPTVHL